jgi:hypothetical protein
MWTDVSDHEAEIRDNLVDRLREVGIRYLGAGHGRAVDHEGPATAVEPLILGLTRSRDARLRTALVALLLRNPQHAGAAIAVSQALDDTLAAQHIQVSALAAAALQQTWAFSLDLYLPGWQPIEADTLAARLNVPKPHGDYGRATLIALDRLLAGDDPVPPDYAGAWEDVGRHVIADLREEAAARGA